MDYKMDLAQLKAAAGSGPLIRHPAAIESVLTSFARMPLSQLYHPTMHAAKPDLVQDLLGFAVPDCQRDLRDLRTGDVLTCLDSHFADPAVPGYETRFADAFFHLTMLPYHFTQPIRSLPRSKGNGASKPSDETASLPQAPTIETIRDKMRHIGSRCLSPLQIQSGLLQIALTDYFSYLCQIDPSGGFDVWREAVEPLLALRPRCATLRVSQDPAFISLGQALLLALELFIHPDDYTIDDTEFQASWLTDMLLVVNCPRFLSCRQNMPFCSVRRSKLVSNYHTLTMSLRISGTSNRTWIPFWMMNDLKKNRPGGCGILLFSGTKC